jgi:hypothetical protein
MGVIGRLDEQVDAVLIEPLRRRDEPLGDEHDEAGQAERPERPAQLPARIEESGAQRAADDLPVWLL